MPKVQSHGKVIIDGKEIDLGDFDDSTADHTHKKPMAKMAKTAQDELEKEVLRQTGHPNRRGM